MPNHDTAMTSVQRAVWDFLVAGYVGQQQATPRKQILARFNSSQGQNPSLLPIDDRTFRDTVSLLVSQFNKPICTISGGGYFVASHPQELTQAVKDLRSRAGLIFERANKLQASEPVKQQGEMF